MLSSNSVEFHVGVQQNFGNVHVQMNMLPPAQTLNEHRHGRLRKYRHFNNPAGCGKSTVLINGDGDVRSENKNESYFNVENSFVNMSFDMIPRAVQLHAARMPHRNGSGGNNSGAMKDYSKKGGGWREKGGYLKDKDCNGNDHHKEPTPNEDGN